MVMYIIASKLNSTFGTIGKATADKMTAKVVEKLRPFTATSRRFVYLVYSLRSNTFFSLIQLLKNR